MPSQFQMITDSASQARSIQQNRVLRNTYLLLALSMIPTALGALVGVKMGFSLLLTGSPLVSFLIFLGIAFGFMWGIEKTKHSSMGVALLLAFTFFMGLMLSRMLSVALGFANGGSLIFLAAAGTGGVFFAMSFLATIVKRDLSYLGKFLFIGLVVLLVASLANLYFQIPALALTVSAVAVMLFSAYLLYDIKRIIDGGEDNYITATLAVYLDLYNLFVNLLNLLMAFAGERD